MVWTSPYGLSCAAEILRYEVRQQEKSTIQPEYVCPPPQPCYPRNFCTQNCIELVLIYSSWVRSHNHRRRLRLPRQPWQPRLAARTRKHLSAQSWDTQVLQEAGVKATIESAFRRNCSDHLQPAVQERLKCCDERKSTAWPRLWYTRMMALSFVTLGKARQIHLRHVAEQTSKGQR